MKRFLTLIGLLFVLTVMASAGYARKIRRARHERVTPIVSVNGSVSPYDILYFAQDLIGTPYRAACSDPSRGFDCSGFVSYVFKSFNFDVPRSSSDFMNVGEKIALEDARPGDVILFTGTRSHHPHSVGHVGIVYSNEGDKLAFIHSTSGKEHGVTITTMDDTYRRRFVRVVRLMPGMNSSFLAAQ